MDTIRPMTKRPKILLVNDDGIHAPGLRHLWEILHPHADLTVVAPASEKSGAGMSITMYNPLHVQEFDWGEGTRACSVSGTPADCVKLALGELLDEPPDFVFSGINKGTNHGRNVFYSGTVGGAIEATLRNIPSVALSCWSVRDTDYTIANEVILPILRFLQRSPLPAGTLLNVNLPPSAPIQGLRLARQGNSYWKETPHRRQHPEGFDYYWLGGVHSDHPEHEESDVHLLQQGYATAVPLRVTELTCHTTLETHRDHFNSLI